MKALEALHNKHRDAAGSQIGVNAREMGRDNLSTGLQIDQSENPKVKSNAGANQQRQA
jgi:hypothetical protein